MTKELSGPADNSALPPIAPELAGWQEVADEYKNWHAALHPHMERLLEQNGVAPEAHETHDHAPHDELDPAIAGLIEDIAEWPSTQKFKNELAGIRDFEPVIYGEEAAASLIAADKIDELVGGIEKTHFKDLGVSVADELMSAGKSKEVARNLDSFSGLTPETARKLIDEGLGSHVLLHIDTFAGVSQRSLAEYAIKKGEGYVVAMNLPHLPELDSSEIVTELAATEQYKAIFYGLTRETMVYADHQGLVDKMLEQDPGSLKGIINGIASLDGVDCQALLEKVYLSDDPYIFDAVLAKIESFPTADPNDLFQKAMDTHDKGVYYALSYVVDKAPIDHTLIRKFMQQCIDEKVGSVLLTYLDKFPEGIIDFQQLADAVLTEGVDPQTGKSSTDLLLLYIGKLRGLNVETFHTIVAEDDGLLYPENIVGSFEHLDQPALDYLVNKGWYSEKSLQTILEHRDTFDVGDAEFISSFTTTKEDAGLHKLIEVIDQFPQFASLVAERAVESESQFLFFIDRLESFANIDKTPLIPKLLQGSPAHVHALISKTELLGISQDVLLGLLANSGRPALELLSQDEQLLSMLPSQGPFGTVFGQSALRVLLDSTDPRQTADELHAVTKEQSLWIRNMRMSKIGAGDVSEKGFTKEYEVAAIPFSFPVSARDGEYSGDASLRAFSDLSDDEKTYVLSSDALKSLETDGMLLSAKTTVGFAELAPEWQDTVLAYRLYESIAKSRSEELREAASQRNKSISEAQSWWQEGDLTHATPSVTNLSNILRNGLLCGEAIGLNSRTDGFPFNVDFVTMSSQVVAKSGHAEKVAALDNDSYGGYVIVVHRDENSTDFQRETKGGRNADHRLVFGAVPATEISAILLRGEAVDKAAVIDATIESGLYVPIIDQDGENILSFDEFERLRVDKNYPAVQPRIIDHGFRLDNTQLGSNEGSIYVSDNGGKLEQYYVKFGDESANKRDHLWTEILADKFYREVTPDLTAESEAVIIDGRLARRSKIVPVDDSPVTEAARNAGFIMDCLVGNWDAVYNNANLVMSDGKALRIDTGNSFDFRARGDKKSLESFDGIVHEIETSSSTSDLGGGMRQLYPGLTDDAVTQQVRDLQDKLPDHKIDELVHSIRRSAQDRLQLARTIKARKQYLIDTVLGAH